MLSSGGELSVTSLEMSPVVLVAVVAPVVGLAVPKRPDMVSQVAMIQEGEGIRFFGCDVVLLS